MPLETHLREETLVMAEQRDLQDEDGDGGSDTGGQEDDRDSRGGGLVSMPRQCSEHCLLPTKRPLSLRARSGRSGVAFQPWDVTSC